jgi:hypothetical protein
VGTTTGGAVPAIKKDLEFKFCCKGRAFTYLYLTDPVLVVKEGQALTSHLKQFRRDRQARQTAKSLNYYYTTMLQDYFLISAARLLGNRRLGLFLGRHPAPRLDGFGLPAEAQAVSLGAF